MKQKQRLEAVGSLAGGISHEFNNILQVIQGFAGFAKQGLDADDQRFKDLDEVIKAARHASELTAKLLSFSQTDRAHQVSLDTQVVMNYVIKQLKPLFGKQIDCRVSIGEKLDQIVADPNGLQQILMNLCLNARDAMPEGGIVEIRFESILLSKQFCELHDLPKPGEFVRISFNDTGTGMNAEQLEHVFDPFFTTKETGKGTGMGMAIVHGIVNQHEGHIDIESEPGRGTTVQVYLPVVPAKPPVRQSDQLPPVTGGNETILLAEDNFMVRSMTTRLLQEAGYSVISACDGNEAVELFREHHEEIAIALLDVVMPGFSGHRVLNECRKICPDLKAVFCTGYDPELAQSGKTGHENFCVVRKPWEPEVLLRAIRLQLDATSPSSLKSASA